MSDTHPAAAGAPKHLQVEGVNTHRLVVTDHGGTPVVVIDTHPDGHPFLRVRGDDGVYVNVNAKQLSALLALIAKTPPVPPVVP